MKISIYLAASANGMISNKKGVPDWLSQEYGQGFFSICAEKNAVIMGKTTYKILAPDNLPLKKDGTMVVLTHHPEASQENVVFTDKSPKDVAALLQDRGHDEAVIIGGASTASEFIKSGLVEDLYLVIEPVLFGNGAMPLLTDVDTDYRLTLKDAKPLNKDTVQLHYRINTF